jgi:hypothetical protein
MDMIIESVMTIRLEEALHHTPRGARLTPEHLYKALRAVHAARRDGGEREGVTLPKQFNNGPYEILAVIKGLGPMPSELDGHGWVLTPSGRACFGGVYNGGSHWPLGIPLVLPEED